MRLRIALASLAIVGLAGCGGGSAASPPAVTVTKTPPKPATFAVHGSLEVDSEALVRHANHNLCFPASGYDDIQQGAAVVVQDATGKAVAIGSLGRGHNGGVMTCSFPFTVTGVPDKDGVYSIEVGHRGKVSYSRADLDSPVTLTLQ